MVRRVKNEAGSKYFGLPVGSIITPDHEDDALAKHGGRPAPPQSAFGTDKKRAGQESTSSGSNAKKTTSNSGTMAAGAKWAAKGFKKPTISGPVPVLVGKEKFSAPEGSGVFKSPKHPGRVYVVTPEGNTHVFTSSGELNLTPAESKALTSQVQSSLEEVVDVNEEAEEKEITWVRLMSLVRQLAQAEKSGDESAAKKLLTQFREAANQYDPDSDSREIRTKVKKSTGAK